MHACAYGDRVLGAEQVGPPDGADEEGPAGEQQQGFVGSGRVGDRVGDVLRGVAGRVEERGSGANRRRSCAVPERPMLDVEPAPAPITCVAPVSAAIAAAGDVVVVQVGLDDVADLQFCLGGLEVDVDITSRVDDRGDTRGLVADERPQMAQTLDQVLAQEHPAEGTTGCR